jgi:hypothetical protein
MDGITLVRELRMLPPYRGFHCWCTSTKKKMDGKAAGATGC